MSTNTLPLVHVELLPDGANYRDTGCSVATACLACPLPTCRYDGGPARLNQQVHDAKRATARKLAAAGAKPRQIAPLLGRSVRSVQRMLRR